jgi:hypothetical protein
MVIVLIFGFLYYEFPICIYRAILFNQSNFIHHVGIGMKELLIFLNCSATLVGILAEMLVIRDRIRINDFFVHIDAVEIDIFYALFFAARRLTLALTLNAKMVIVLIGSIDMLAADYFFIVGSIENGIIANSKGIAFLARVEMRRIILF